MIGATVVIVDDHPEILDLLQILLEDEGYRVVTVVEPGAIPRAIEGHEPSVFLIDLMLPGLNGIALAEHLRSGTHGMTPFIAMSASGAMIRRAADSGRFIDTLQKPFDVDELLGCLARHLPGRQDGRPDA
ncbi:MAG TPA: response regulator [Chloroflexota bacterium]|nr:response regulator [Chloroflexota bacterium]